MNLSPQDKIFVQECSEKIFAIFSPENKFLRFNGRRYYLSGEFEGKTLNPADSVASAIFKIAELKTFKNDPRYVFSTFGPLKIIHPDDINRLDFIFSGENAGFHLESTNLEQSLIQFACIVIGLLKNGHGKVRVSFEKGDLFPKLLCVLLGGGLAKRKTEVGIFSLI